MSTGVAVSEDVGHAKHWGRRVVLLALAAIVATITIVRKRAIERNVAVFDARYS